ncbi:MAG TPA: prepilin-type N-terminal cleavage/methylation domain-containing protein [Anaerohalosphaeraceae bacterium]|nr:prepilin-type N-terminal cleavage/methylation domain-containing protein [Anaerohalosphaeraceae bacterium]
MKTVFINMNVKRKQNRGFTMAEMLVALMVASIILAAAATMAGALSAGKTANDQVSRNGAYLLQLQTRLTDLIMRANRVAGIDSQGLTLWLDKNNNGLPDIATEYVYVRTSATRDWVIISGTGFQENYKQSSNVQFYLDNADKALVKHITVQFNMVENGVTQTYTISGTLRGKTN